MENEAILIGQNFSIKKREGGYFNVETNGLVIEQCIESHSQPQVIAALCAQQQAALVEMAGMLMRYKEGYEQIKTEGKAESKPAKSCTCGENDACGDCVVEEVKKAQVINACYVTKNVESIVPVKRLLESPRRLIELLESDEVKRNIEDHMRFHSECYLRARLNGNLEIELDICIKA